MITIFKDESMTIDVTETLLKKEECVQVEATSESEVRLQKIFLYFKYIFKIEPT